ncbi:MAG: hypothetical protein KC457_02230 [Myxococcales bacterium]|nr:hypothetical protein [Myxococcales bacterium]
MRPCLALTVAVVALASTACFKIPDGGGDELGDTVGTDTADTGTDTSTSTGTDTTDTTTDTDTDTTDTTDTGMSQCVSELDILVVLDNSGSMGTIQRRVAEGIAGLIVPLDSAGVSWRLGVTTSDNGNPWCPAGTTTPEAGRLVFSSCKTRLDDFLFGDSVNVQDIACNDICALDEIATKPTTTEFDPTPTPRAWLEGFEGGNNLLGDLDVASALACLLPQGVNGCGFESQLESSYLALLRSNIVDELNYGFLRSEAALLVLIVSDEADCSYNKDWETIFAADGNKAFWSDPNASFPTSAVCWNAGVECLGDPSKYSSCSAVNKDVDGNSTNTPSAAVLHPLSRYQGLLSELAADKPALRVALIGGVNANGIPTYADAGMIDPSFQDSFGIGPSCIADDPFLPGNSIKAVPPVRMLEVSKSWGGDVASVCADSFIAALGEIASAFVSDC